MPNNTTERTVFVTVGTTLFEALIQAMTNEQVLHKLAQLGFTKLILQYGNGHVPILPATKTQLPLQVEMYSFKPTLTDDMQHADLILGHAGAGTVSEVLRYQKKRVVVINTALMHNHQTELAHAMRDRHHLHVIEEPTWLLQPAVWDEIARFQPVPLPPGDPHDFPRLLNAFLDH